jgi:dynein heavy chain 2
VTETEESVSRKELSLSQKSAVVELTGAKMMRVNFDPRLTRLIREGRGLAGQGVELPREVKDLVERASALTGRARALQQVANFHNTIGDRMIPSQRPLMLATALELAGAVREQSSVVWSDHRAVDAFTSRLQELVNAPPRIRACSSQPGYSDSRVRVDSSLSSHLNFRLRNSHVRMPSSPRITQLCEI